MLLEPVDGLAVPPIAHKDVVLVRHSLATPSVAIEATAKGLILAPRERSACGAPAQSRDGRAAHVPCSASRKGYRDGIAKLRRDATSPGGKGYGAQYRLARPMGQWASHGGATTAIGVTSIARSAIRAERQGASPAPAGGGGRPLAMLGSDHAGRPVSMVGGAFAGPGPAFAQAPAPGVIDLSAESAHHFTPVPAGDAMPTTISASTTTSLAGAPATQPAAPDTSNVGSPATTVPSTWTSWRKPANSTSKRCTSLNALATRGSLGSSGIESRTSAQKTAPGVCCDPSRHQSPMCKTLRSGRSSRRPIRRSHNAAW